MASALQGLLLGLSLIVAIGAQNIWVLSQSMAGANRWAIALGCIGCDAALIVLGVYGASTVQAALPLLLPLMTMAGVAMLLYLAWQAARRAYLGAASLQLASVSRAPWQQTLATALAISLLNPHVYLDTVVLLGSIGAVQPSPPLFALGAAVASCLWFGALTGFAPRLKLLLSSPQRWRLFDSCIALILCGIAMQLALHAQSL